MTEPSSYGWTAVPRSQKELLKSADWSKTKPLRIEELPTPDSALAKRVQEYAKAELPEKVYNHSMRVYYYGKFVISLLAERSIVLHGRSIGEHSQSPV